MLAVIERQKSGLLKYVRQENLASQIIPPYIMRNYNLMELRMYIMYIYIYLIKKVIRKLKNVCVVKFFSMLQYF